MSKLIGKTMAMAKALAVDARPKLIEISRYAKVELTPPKLSDLPAIKNGFGKIIHSAKSGGYRDLTVKQALLNTLIGVEIWCWFFVGECIGKGRIAGYNV